MQSFIALTFQFLFVLYGSAASLMALYYAMAGNLEHAGLFFLMCISLYVLSLTASPDLK